jgi:glutaredoxin
MPASRISLFGLVLLVLAISGASQWWGHRQEARLGERLARAATPGDLHMLSSDTCAICVVARQWFTQHGVAFSECSIERDPACRAEFERLQAPGTPVILVRGQPELGFNPSRLQSRLEGS